MYTLVAQSHMQISKHSQSCLIVKDQGKVVLLDPGSYTVEEHALDLNQLPQLDAIGITHDHQDHLDIALLKQILKKFPNTSIFSNTSVKDLLAKENITVTITNNDYISMTDVPHEKIWMGPSPQNSMITLFNRFTTVGDSLTFTSSAEILALPIQAPWGSTTAAVEKALEVMPKIIIPIHDFQWKDEVRISMYDRLEEYFKQHKITFLKPLNGQEFEV